MITPMAYKPSQQLIDILLNAEFRLCTCSIHIKNINKKPIKTLLYQSNVLYSFKLKGVLVKLDHLMITVSYKGDPIYRTEALSTDQLRSVIFYARLNLADRQKFIRCKLDPFNMPAVIEKIDYYFNTLRSSKYYGYNELIAQYKRIVLPEPDN
jgi:hypothetical protein